MPGLSPPVMHNLPDAAEREAGGQLFPVTQWTQVAAAGAGDVAALGAVCERYWEPARRFLRALGAEEEDAGDLVEEFFAKWQISRAAWARLSDLTTRI